MIEFPWIFRLVTVFFQTEFPTSSGLSLGEGGMPLHKVGVNCKKSATIDIKAKVPSIWATGCRLDICECII